MSANILTGLGPRDYSGSPHRNQDRASRYHSTRTNGRQTELSYDDALHTDGHQRSRNGDEDDESEDGRIYESDVSQEYDDEEAYNDGNHRDRRHDRYRDSRRYLDLDYDGDSRRYSTSPQRNRQRSFSPKSAEPTNTVVVECVGGSIPRTNMQPILYSSTNIGDYPTTHIRFNGGRFLFIEFQSVDDSISWMETNHPTVNLQFPGTGDVSNEPLPCRTFYVRSRSSNAAASFHENRDVSRKRNRKMPDASSYRQQLTGATDTSTTPSQILVLYPLAASVTEDILAAGAKQLEKEEKSNAPVRAEGAPKLKSTAPVGDTSGLGAKKNSMHRVILMRDTRTNTSMNYGFAEFWTLEDAMAAMAKFQKSRTFTIESAPVMVSTIHLGVFVPETREVLPSIDKQSFHPLFNPAIRVRYRDLRVYPSIKIVASEPPRGAILPSAAVTSVEDDKKAKKRKGDALASGTAKKPVVMAGQIAMWQKKHAEISQPTPNGPSKSSANSIPVTSRNAPIKISLGGLSKSLGASTPELKVASASSESPAAATSEKTTPETEERITSFIDRDKLQCLLCMMKYKSLDDCDTHERSRNHTNAMQNEDKVKAATERMIARFKKKLASNTAASESQYRDRAQERRAAFNQPDQPISGKTKSNVKDSGPKSKQNEKPVPPEKPLVATGKGSSLLSKMGWTAGTGLGANGAGRTDIIATHAYQDGVGLGAEGGNLGDAQALAEKKTTGRYSDYLETVQDKARERYRQLE
ncbi:hypothetical protein BROUX41_003079 [Berkeleyomyces rouxiae]